MWRQGRCWRHFHFPDLCPAPGPRRARADGDTDFAAHLARNANLSLKAIVALGGFGELCERTGKTSDARMYRRTAQQFARQWIPMAADGDHYSLAFETPGVWGQKHNLV